MSSCSSSSLSSLSSPPPHLSLSPSIPRYSLSFTLPLSLPPSLLPSSLFPPLTELENLDRFSVYMRIDSFVHIFCFSPTRRSSQLALRQAKINVLTNYLLVGVTEELEDFLFALEALLPEFFKGVLDIYKVPGWMVVLLFLFVVPFC